MPAKPVTPPDPAVVSSEAGARELHPPEPLAVALAASMVREMRDEGQNVSDEFARDTERFAALLLADHRSGAQPAAFGVSPPQPEPATAPEVDPFKVRTLYVVDGSSCDMGLSWTLTLLHPDGRPKDTKVFSRAIDPLTSQPLGAMSYPLSLTPGEARDLRNRGYTLTLAPEQGGG